MNENDFEFLENIREEDLVTASDKELEQKLNEEELCSNYGDAGLILYCNQ